VEALDPALQSHDGMKCDRATSCPLHKLFATPFAIKVWRLAYCEGDFSRCERRRLFAEGKDVPVHLLPNGKKMDPGTHRALG